MANRVVYVVETWLRHQRRWYAWSASPSIRDSWRKARELRAAYPKEKFRTIHYINGKP